MKHVFCLVVVASLASPALADSVALDYRASDASCVDASRFADEVSAKLGFVPWSAAAPAKIRVRVEKDGGQFTGSVLNTDGSSKIIDGPTCTAVTSKLAITVAGAMDPAAFESTAKAPVAAPAPAKPDADGKVAVSFASAEGRRVDIAMNTGGGAGVSSTGASVVTAFFETVCTTPCTTRLPPGRHYLSFVDPDSKAAAGEKFIIDAPTTITLHHKSTRGKRWAIFAAGVALTSVGAYGLFAMDGTTGIVTGTLGLCLGIPLMGAPIYLHDTFSTTRSP
jgi:hypothetical protein